MRIGCLALLGMFGAACTSTGQVSQDLTNAETVVIVEDQTAVKSGGLLVTGQGSQAVQFDDFVTAVPKATLGRAVTPAAPVRRASVAGNICQEGSPSMIRGSQYCLVGIHR